MENIICRWVYSLLHNANAWRTAADADRLQRKYDRKRDTAQSGSPVFWGEITSAIGIDTGLDVTAARGGADEISRRLESLPASSYVWRLVILLSLGGCFEVYDLFFTGYIAPGLNRSIVIIAIAIFGPNVRGKPLDA